MSLFIFLNISFGPTGYWFCSFLGHTCITNTSPQCNNFPLGNYYCDKYRNIRYSQPFSATKTTILSIQLLFNRAAL